MTPYLYIKNRHTADAILLEIKRTQAVHAIDIETTGLHPSQGAKVRLVQISGPVGRFVIDHFMVGPFEDYVDAYIDACDWAVFNVGFEGRWFDYYDDEKRVALLDVGLMSKARLGGRPLSLAQMVERDLGKKRDKSLQLSDWSAPELTLEQLEYAMEDADDTYALFIKWRDELKEHGLDFGFQVLNDAWRGTAEMEDCGMLIDEDHHRKLITMWEKRRQAAEKAIRKLTPESVLPNIRSAHQKGAIIAATLDPASLAAWPKTDKTSQLKLKRDILRQASFRAPYPFSRWLAALMVFGRADKYLSTYGEKLLTIQAMRGRVYARFNIAQAITGRYSSSEPNLQNIPRSKLVRRSFIAPQGAVMVLADYSGIELRVLAELSGDEQLKQDVIYGNVHAENAVLIYKHVRDEYFARLAAKDPRAGEQRSKSKAFSFQLTYGAGVGALALALRCSDAEAALHVENWAKRYPKAYHYRFRMFEQMQQDGFLPIKDYRTIYVPRQDRSVPVASNYPVQGAAADVMLRAVHHFHEAIFLEMWHDEHFNARMMASVHDELLALSAPHCAERTKELMYDAMIQGWLDIFPGTSTDNLVEPVIGTTWADKA